ncbi:hypothetical protein ACGRQ9_01545 [Vibrio rumoiensis]|uniref:DUF7657 domain-containing protein n=1 Tax=Vibrio rumoiensis TaxID=76258 RepID=A0ABW7IRF2_9VIBR
MDLAGLENTTLFGHPRSIRSDEWAVWTPYFQAIINNNFHRFDEHSLYNIDFRNFYSLPVLDWGLIFKPLMWPFFIFEPARAFSLYNGLVIFLNVVGYKCLFERLFTNIGFRERAAFIIFSLILYYSTFTQMWLTTLGPILAMSPWLILCVLSWKNNSIIYYLTLFYIATCWMLSHAYPPIIISVAYFGLFTILVFDKEFFLNKKRVFFTIIACVSSCLVVYLYFSDIISIMMNTTYPGKRIAQSGTVVPLLWLSTIFPYIVQSGYKDLIAQNICEISTISSLLPLITVFFLNYKSDIKFGRVNYLLYILFYSLFSAWMLFDIPSILGRLTLLSLVPPQRLLWLTGLIVNLFSFHILLLKGPSITYKRIIAFSLFLLIVSNVSSLFGYIGLFDKSLWELLSIPFVYILYVATRNKYKNFQTIGLMIVCLLVNMLYTFSFNPIQSSEKIFSIGTSEQVSYLKELESQQTRNWTVLSGYPGATLYGFGLNSFTNVLMKPDLSFFRNLYPDLPNDEFNYIFNRYAHIHLYDGTVPDVPQPDVIRVPFSDVQKTKFSDVLVEKKEYLTSKIRGNIDSVILDGNILKVTGWSYRKIGEPIYINVDSHLINLMNIARNDVVSVTHEKELLYSGFQLSIYLTEQGLQSYKDSGICIMFESAEYGKSRLNYNLDSEPSLCRNFGNFWRFVQ